MNPWPWPAPVADDAAAHLVRGTPVPAIPLPTTANRTIVLSEIAERTALFVYPWTGQPGADNPPRWDDIPGAHGSTPGLIGVANLFTGFEGIGVRVLALSGQSTAWQQAFVARNRLPFEILSDEAGALRDALRLPTFETGGVRYLVARREEFRGKRVVIAGGGDSAVDWALSLKDVAAQVTVVHRRDKFRCAPESAAQLKEAGERGEIDLAIPYQLQGLEGIDGALSGVTLATLKGELKTVPADHLLAFFGLSMELGPIAEWGLGLERNHVAVAPATCETNIPGLHAIGDIATYPGKLKLILQGFSEAAMAAHAIHPRVFPGEALHFEYSTSKGVPV